MLRKGRIQAVTLISMLVGIALGTFLIVTMLQIFTSVRANYKLSENLAEMNDVLRYASVLMSDIISQAGYRTPDATTGILPAYDSAFPTFSNVLTGPTGSTYNTSTTNSDDPAGVVLSYFPGEDVIVTSLPATQDEMFWVKFQGDTNGRIRDCNDLYGVTDTAIRVNFYSRQTTINGVTGTGYYCERYDNGTNYTYSTNAISGTPIIPTELFDQAWVRYGESITSSQYIDRWSLGPDVQDRNRVYAVRVAFLIHSRDDVRSNDATQTFYVFGDTVSFTDKKIHKLYMFTVMLPNAPNYTLANQVTTP